MAQEKSTSPITLLKEGLLDDPDFLQGIVSRTLQTLLDSEFTDFLGAEAYERNDSRRGHRNGRYSRTVYTRVGAVELQVPRDRKGEFSPTLFSRYRRSEKALMLSLVEMVIQGVSTNKVRKITEQLCGTDVSSSTVSRLHMELDAELAIWRNRPIGVCPYLFVDARYEKVRHAGRIVSMAVNIVYAVTAEGYRTILDVSVSHSENEADYKRLFNGLKKRGLTGVDLIISDDHEGLTNAINACFSGASWQRCQVHFLRNLFKRVRKNDRVWVMAGMKDVFASQDKKTAFSRLASLVERLQQPYPEIADWLEDEGQETLTIYDFPEKHRKRCRTTNNIERLNQEIKRRTRVIRIFPNEASVLRIVTALCQEQSEVWETERRYLTMDNSLISTENKNRA